MIKKSFFYFLILTLGYTIFIYCSKIDLDTSQNMWNANMISCEVFLHEEKNISEKSVIVGSSLAAALKAKYLPDDVINLAFGGGSIFDGLALVNRKAEKPKVVFIEMNVLLRGQNKEMEQTINNPVTHFLKDNLVVARDKNQPVGIFANTVFHYGSQFISGSTLEKEDSIVTIKNEASEEVMNQLIESQSRPLDEDKVNQSIDELKKFVILLEQQGICIAFFEMPIEKILCNSVQSKTIRNAFFTNFPQSDYFYISQPQLETYHTNDGLHLNQREAKKYLAYFLREKSKLNCN